MSSCKITEKPEKPNISLLCDVKCKIDKINEDISSIKKDIQDIFIIIDAKKQEEIIAQSWWWS